MSEDEEFISKTRVKQEMHELQELGEHLSGLPDSIRARLELPEMLETAIVDYRRFDSRGARKRQLQYIGKVMRDIDAEEIKQILARMQFQTATDLRKKEALEKLVYDLLSNENPVLNRLIERCPDLDIQQLRQVLRQCRKEQTDNEDYTLSSGQSGQKLLDLIKALDISPEQITAD